MYTMIYLGIDVAKDSHVAAAITSDGEVVLKPFPFANSCSGFAKLKSRLDEFPCDSLLIGLESTAHYGENLTAYLVQNAYQVALLNPLQTAALRKSAIRKTKTDNSFLIAKSMMVDGYRLLEPNDIHLLKLRGLCKTRQNLILLRTRCKIQLGAFVDQLFPELNDFFRAGLLSMYPTPCSNSIPAPRRYNPYTLHTFQTCFRKPQGGNTPKSTLCTYVNWQGNPSAPTIHPWLCKSTKP